jgi:hypothetical protein
MTLIPFFFSRKLIEWDWNKRELFWQGCGLRWLMLSSGNLSKLGLANNPGCLALPTFCHVNEIIECYIW